MDDFFRVSDGLFDGCKTDISVPTCSAKGHTFKKGFFLDGYNSALYRKSESSIWASSSSSSSSSARSSVSLDWANV